MADASSRGWGPACSGRIVTVDVSGTRFPSGVRAELAELVSLLVAETKSRGYQFGNQDDPSYGCWGYNCRHISGSSSWSNHAWGLAVDINAPTNPHKKPLTTDMPGWMPDLWESYGFRWGGTYSKPDAMHYEFMGSPADCAQQTGRARVELGSSGGYVPPEPEVPDVTPEEHALLEQAALNSSAAAISASEAAAIAAQALDAARVAARAAEAAARAADAATGQAKAASQAAAAARDEARDAAASGTELLYATTNGRTLDDLPGDQLADLDERYPFLGSVVLRRPPRETR